MADYKYLGLTTYIKYNADNDHKLKILRDGLDGMCLHEDDKEFNAVVRSDAYNTLNQDSHLTYPSDCELPEHTPIEYARTVIQDVEINGVWLTRIYVPAVAKNEDSIKNFIHNAVRPVIHELFGNDVIHMRVKESIEYENFQDGKETILVSVNDQMAVPA